jgi:hypothetical protein
MHGSGEPDLRFDYQGILRLARQLWALADTVENVTSGRQTAAQEAAQDFFGAYGDRFRERMNDECSDSKRLVSQLRADAGACAQRWADAMNEESLRLYSRHYDKIKHQRNIVQEAWTTLFGDPDVGYPPAPVSVPRPPMYVPTAELLRYP